MDRIDRVTLFEEYRLIERSESEVSGVWKGAHLLLFFLAFVFGSFCTFCFHMLMYLFDEKCVLFPKLLSLSSLKHNVIYEFIPEDKEVSDNLPVDFLSTQWVEKSACYLPTYVPVVSGIFGLIWTTMFLMYSTGSRALAGSQRSWRVMPPVFLFSLAMSALCIYSSAITHYGLQELCSKLGEITGSSTCSYTVNVVTLVYERRIRGVYQATRLTIASAWLHTACWIMSALLAMTRVLLVVDFQLVKVTAELIGDMDKMLERHEKHLRTVSPNVWIDEESNQGMQQATENITKVHFQNKSFDTESINNEEEPLTSTETDVLLFAAEKPPRAVSELSVVSEELRFARLEATKSINKEQFIVKLLYDLVDSINIPESPAAESLTSVDTTISPQFRQQIMSTKAQLETGSWETSFESVNLQEAKAVAKEITRDLLERLYMELIELPIQRNQPYSPNSSKKRGHIAFDSSMNISQEMRQNLQDTMKINLRENDSEEETQNIKKSNMKHVSIQTDKNKTNGKNEQNAKISESRSTFIKHDSSTDSDEDEKEALEGVTTPKDKDEKQGEVSQTHPKEALEGVTTPKYKDEKQGEGSQTHPKEALERVTTPKDKDEKQGEGSQTHPKEAPEEVTAPKYKDEKQGEGSQAHPKEALEGVTTPKDKDEKQGEESQTHPKEALEGVTTPKDKDENQGKGSQTQPKEKQD